MKPKHLRCAVLALVAVAPLNAEELRFDNAAQWRQWTLPIGIVELTPQGVVRPLAVRKNINAALDALDHGGGLRDASGPTAPPRPWSSTATLRPAGSPPRAT